MRQTHFSLSSAQQGVVLIEAMVAILLFSVGVLAIAGLQAAMLQNTSASEYRAEASYIAQQTIGQMWVAPVINEHVVQNQSIAGRLPGGFVSVVRPNVADADQYLITVGWTAPGEEAAEVALTETCQMPVAHCFTTLATITPINPL